MFGVEHPKTVEAVELLADIRSEANNITSRTKSKEKSEFYLCLSPVNSDIYNLSSSSC